MPSASPSQRFLLSERIPRRVRPLVLTAIYGLAAGLLAVAFEVGINVFFAMTLGQLSRASPGVFLAGSLGMVVGTALAAGWLLARFCPEAAGSGIPQLKLAFWKDFGYVPARVVWVKFVAGLLTIGGGSSLGREGPTVHLAGGATSWLAGRLGVAKQARRGASAAGAAAGLAAAFNAPLASIAFVLEEIIEDLNSPLLGSVIVAAVLGAFTVHAILGSHPAFDLPEVHAPSWRGYGLVPVAAAAAALVGVAFQAAALGLRRAFRRTGGFLRRVPPAVRPALGALLTWALGVAVFLPTGHLGVFGLGYDDLMAGLSGRLGWEVAAALLGAKVLATVAGYGTGGCGGIFAPNLFFGALTGAALAGAARAAGVPLDGDDQVLLGIVGMSACLGAVVRAPVTSILIVFEMTHEFSLVPALMVGGLISQGISRALLRHNFYEQVLLDDGHLLRTVVPPRDLRGWGNLPVSAIANFQPVVLQPDVDLEPARLRETLENRPFTSFPVQSAPEKSENSGSGGEQSRPVPAPGLLRREEAIAALDAGQPPPVRPRVATCLREDSIRDAQAALLASDENVVLLLDRPGGIVVGLLTLHDLLRAQENHARAAEV